jgi:uncharacterized protein YaiI (UPF0178 family)
VVILVVDKPLRAQPSRHIKTAQIPAGFDAADDGFVLLLRNGAPVIITDILLTVVIISKDGHTLGLHGEFYNKDDIQEILALRNLPNELPGSGIVADAP